MDYSLKRWSTFTRFLDDGRICMTNNAAERAVRGIAIGRRNWTFCGSDAGGERAAVIFTLIETATLCDVDPRACLADVLACIADHPATPHRPAAAVELADGAGSTAGRLIRPNRLRPSPDAYLALASLDHACRDHRPDVSATLTTMAFDHSRSRWLGDANLLWSSKAA
jgi:hypothetical protein